MASISIPDDLKAQAARRATDAGYASVDDFVAALVRAEITGAPEGLTVDDDDALRHIVASRLDGPWVDADAADFARIRAKFAASLDTDHDTSAPASEPRP